MDLEKLRLSPSQSLNVIGKEKFFLLISELIQELVLYKGIKVDEQIQAKIIEQLYSLKNTFMHLSINETVATIEKMMYYDDIKKISTELFHKKLQSRSIDKFKIIDEKEQKEVESVANDPVYGTALRIRLLHDPKGRIMDRDGFTLKEIYDAVKNGFNIYTNERI